MDRDSKGCCVSCGFLALKVATERFTIPQITELHAPRRASGDAFRTLDGERGWIKADPICLRDAISFQEEVGEVWESRHNRLSVEIRMPAWSAAESVFNKDRHSTKIGNAKVGGNIALALNRWYLSN
jgi:hypothetical protein